MMWLYGLGALLLALFVYAVWIEPAWRLRIVRYDLPVPGWTGRAPVTIAIISDLHAGGPHVPASRVRRIVRRAMDEGADMGVLLGDYAAAHPFTVGMMSFDQIIAALSEFHPPLGTYAVLGNHDWWQDAGAIDEGRLPVAAQALRDHGFTLLENAALPLRDGPDRFWVVGLGDQRPLSLDPTEDGFDDIDLAMQDVDGSEPAILLAHEPDIFPDVPGQIVLTLSGHTHGGQIRVAGRSPIIMAVECEKYAYGHYQADAQHLIVSGGIGCSDYPIRFGIPPEITIVTLRAGDGADPARVAEAA